MTVEWYISLKWLHIASACIGFGSNVTHFFWVLSANADPANRTNILRLVKKIDDRLSVPSYAVMTVCGVAMWLAQWPTSASWLVASMVLTAILAIMGTAYGPFMKKWIRLSADQAADRKQFAALARWLTIAWAGISLTVFVVLYLMVWKPALW